VCLPGLHITLGVFFRLFTLLEDECHKLDLELATLTSPEESDRQSYINFAAKVHQERVLLDQRDTLIEELDSLKQTLAFLVLHTTTDATNDLAVVIVADRMIDTKKELSNLVRFNRFMEFPYTEGQEGT